MDLNALHSMMSAKGYHYFEGSTNSTDDRISINFSNGNGGRGDSLDLLIGADTTNADSYKYGGEFELQLTKHENLNDFELFALIETL